MKTIGTLTDNNDVTKTPIKVEVNGEDIVFISQGDEQMIVVSKPFIPALIEVLQRLTA